MHGSEFGDASTPQRLHCADNDRPIDFKAIINIFLLYLHVLYICIPCLVSANNGIRYPVPRRSEYSSNLYLPRSYSGCQSPNTRPP